MSISEIAAKYDVSRSSVHNYRRGGTFPRPAPVEGTEKTKLRFRSDEVASWFEANPKSQGKRTDLANKQQGEPVTTTDTPREWRLTPETLDLFVEAYGAEAGNLALRSVATAGVYVGGGIAPKILPALQDGRFMEAFRAKGTMTELASRVPVNVILNPEAGLVGAAVFSGTVFALALGGPRWLGAVTPIGGLLMILAFLLFVAGALRL